MKRKDWLFGFTALGLLFSIAWLLWPEQQIVFANLQEAWTEIKAKGFHCAADREDGVTETGFLVTRAPATFDDVTHVCMAGPMDQKWKGKVWVRPHPRS